MPGPGDFVLLVGKHLCELSSSIRWAAFLDNEEIQEDLRAIAFELSSWLGNPLYAPDLFGLNAYLFDEHTMQEARIWLYREYGDPSSDMKSMLHDWKAENEYRKYYIDEFTD
ncbi:hypothetical protein ACFO9Q_11030 [Paenibacillus sp. GCM10023252]|uniref:hypothetical protein n=1 Tax=Paenibacillus sp. GCM10023252 TaxID=3252649 RepID=UPI00360AE5A9